MDPRWTLAILLLGQTALLLLGPWYPTTDGASHLYNAKLMLEAGNHTDLFEWNSWYLPQWIGPSILAGQVAALGIEWGFRVHVWMASLALTAVVGLTRRQEAAAPVLALVISLGYVFSMGFFGYTLGIALMAAVILLWDPRQPLRFALLLTLCYFTHLVPFALAVGTLGLLTLARRDLRGLATLAACATPGIVFTALYLIGGPKIPYILPQGPQPWSTWWKSVLAYPFMPLSTERPHQHLVLTMALLFAMAIGFALLKRRREGEPWRPDDVLLALALALPLIAPKLPDGGAGGSILQSRIGQCGPVFAVLWLAEQRFWPRQRLFLGAAALLVGCQMLHLRYQFAEWMAPLHRDVRAAASMLEPGSAVVAIEAWPLGYDFRDRERSLWIRPLAHVDGLLSAEAGVLNLFNYEAASGVFPLRFRDGRSPDVPLFHGHPPPDPPIVRLREYESWQPASLPRRPLRYVVLINPYGPRADHPNFRRLLDELDERFRIRGETAGKMVRVYERR